MSPPEKKESFWPRDEFARHEMYSQMWQILSVLILVILGGVLAFSASSARQTAREVVAYCSQDQVYAESIFQEFTRETKIQVRAVYDNEAVKTVGLANRLVAERAHPRCDVVWGNEEMRTRQLAAQGIFRETAGWAAFGYRSRRVVINTNQVSIAIAPESLLELTNSRWRGKVAIAYPQFGTTATHFHALRQLWGESAWRAWCRALAANQPRIVDGNSVVVSTVGRGDAWIGLTDSDDIAAGQAAGQPIAALPMNGETLLIPNTVAVARGAPHPEAAQRLFEYLQDPKTMERLVAARALEGAAAHAVTTATLKVNWDVLLKDLEKATEELNQIFLRR